MERIDNYNPPMTCPELESVCFDVAPGDMWLIGFDGVHVGHIAYRCPCGCDEFMLLPVAPTNRPGAWGCAVDDKGLVTMEPSIFRQEGCRSHYLIRGGRVQWC